MVTRFWNRSFRPSKGAKIYNFPRAVSSDPHGRLHKFKGHNLQWNLLGDEQNSERGEVKKGGSNVKGDSTMALGPRRRPFLHT